ncbi:MAG: type II toxin-antitoxin system RelE/ParE family toxin [Clostridiales Family XIII bacterium]|jgi:proteic killer suppression protein|nr:type II toxin-antitoxin system RelE/ParE family toxin [Clostridiales Family XIII bacterium]
MIVSFSDKATEELFQSGSAAPKKIPGDIRARILRKLTLIDSATRIDDLMVPPSNRLHKLDGNRAGQYSVSVNMQWRICFRFQDGDAYDVEFCDYH